METEKVEKKMNTVDRKNIEFVIDKDFCPEIDTILTQDMCRGCPYYMDFFLYLGQRCVRCTYYYRDDA